MFLGGTSSSSKNKIIGLRSKSTGCMLYELNCKWSTNRSLDICKNQVKNLDIYLSAMNTPIIEQLRFSRRDRCSFDYRNRIIRFVSSFNIILTRNHIILNSHKLYLKLMARVNATIGPSGIMFALERYSFQDSSLTYTVCTVYRGIL